MAPYFSWLVASGVIERTMPDGGVVHVSTLPDAAVAAAGWWGTENLRPEYCLSGGCLFDARWQLQFPAQNKGHQGAVRTLSLPRERDDAYARLKKGQTPLALHLPKGPGVYQQTLIRWQAAVFRRLQPTQILYHLPTDEYRVYIQEMEQHLGYAVPAAYTQLDQLAVSIRALMVREFGAALMARVRFVRPMHTHGVKDTTQSYLHPYLFPELYGITPANTVGVEDLVELRLAYEAWRMRGHQISVYAAALALPPPYADKTLRPGEFTTVELM